MIHRNRGNRRWRDRQKATRKQKISHFHKDIVTGGRLEWYKHFGQYKKGKVHCSCPLCRAKTNDEFYGHRNYKPTDRRKIEALDERETLFNSKEEE